MESISFPRNMNKHRAYHQDLASDKQASSLSGLSENPPTLTYFPDDTVPSSSYVPEYLQQ